MLAPRGLRCFFFVVVVVFPCVQCDLSFSFFFFSFV